MTDSTLEFLNVRELAEHLRVSIATVYRMVETRRIPFYRFPRGLRFRRSDIATYLERCRVESVSMDYGR